MKAKTLLILAVLAGAAGLGAWLLAFRPGAATPGSATPAETEPLLMPAVREHAESIARVEIVTGHERLELEKKDGGWVVASLSGYPAVADDIRRLVTSLSELRAMEPKTARSSLYDRLGVQWPPDEDAGAEADNRADPALSADASRPTLVRMMDREGEVITEVVLGKTAFILNQSRQYARLLEAEQSYLASASIRAPTDPMDWVNSRLIELPRESVRRATITHPTGETITVARDDGQADFTIRDVPPGMEPIGGGLTNRVGNALVFVNFTEVRPAAEDDENADNAEADSAGSEADAAEDADGGVVVAEYETFDGLVFRFRIEPAELGGWVTIVAEGEGAGAYNARFEGWSFRVPQGTAESLTRKPSDLMQESVTAEAGPAAPDDAVPELLRPPGDGG